MPNPSETTYFRKGLGHKDQVAPLLHADYHSGLVEYFKHNGYRLREGTTELRLAREFGFCYGVDRAVEYAYECRNRFPEKRIWITGEIIHNPWVNRRLEEMGIQFLRPRHPRESGEPANRLDDVADDDVVLIPAFGMEHDEFEKLRDRGVILVDTTCGSVLSVWKSVERYARDGFTAVIHGKVDHEETRATCSQLAKHENGKYLVLRDKEEASWVCRYLEGEMPGDELLGRLDGACSPGFDPERDLRSFGLANQTTMLSSESLEIARMLRDAMIRRHGHETAKAQYRSFDTICSATQDRQDAVIEMLEDPCDLMIVIGGFNSSNTTHLLEICLPVTRAYHVEDADCLISPDWIRHKPLGDSGPVMEEGWFDRAKEFTIGVTAGASTPDSAVGATLAKILAFRSVPEERLRALSKEGSEITAALRREKGKPELPVLG